MLGIDELGAFRADNFTPIGGMCALERIGEVDETVSAHNVHTGNNVGWQGGLGPGRPPGPRRAKRRVPECWEWRICRPMPWARC
ncbi:hypothetical protein GCM10010446_25310 [Streptomyces enissocaesilis]|uniref:Uncharacterized protein n=1 Tax=Streptomyces enissocaesilis TaxID=332589 RepID=A0ABP6JQN8_9ACTN